MKLTLHIDFTTSLLLIFGVIIGMCTLAVLLWAQKYLQGRQKWYGPVLWLLGVSLWSLGFLRFGSDYGSLRFGTIEANVVSWGPLRVLYFCLAGTAVWVIGLLLSWRLTRFSATPSQQMPEQESIWPPPPKRPTGELHSNK